jgi:hypothetical protein
MIFHPSLAYIGSLFLWKWYPSCTNMDFTRWLHIGREEPYMQLLHQEENFNFHFLLTFNSTYFLTLHRGYGYKWSWVSNPIFSTSCVEIKLDCDMGSIKQSTLFFFIWILMHKILDNAFSSLWLQPTNATSFWILVQLMFLYGYKVLSTRSSTSTDINYFYFFFRKYLGFFSGRNFQ